jgi:hypothetical protein
MLARSVNSTLGGMLNELSHVEQQHMEYHNVTMFAPVSVPLQTGYASPHLARLGLATP